MVPVADVPPATLLTCHWTAVLLEPVTDAMNCCVPPAETIADVGVIATETTCVGAGALEAALFDDPPPQESVAIKRAVATKNHSGELDR